MDENKSTAFKSSAVSLSLYGEKCWRRADAVNLSITHTHTHTHTHTLEPELSITGICVFHWDLLAFFITSARHSPL